MLTETISDDVWDWMQRFVATPSDFYNGKFAPCPYARGALHAQTVSVNVWERGDRMTFVRDNAEVLVARKDLTTLVIVLPQSTRYTFGLTEHIEDLNARLVGEDVFLNTGVALGTSSKYPGEGNTPYFVVVANKLEAVLRGAAALQKTDFYEKWPRQHYELVVERRAVFAQKYGGKG